MLFHGCWCEYPYKDEDGEYCLDSGGDVIAKLCSKCKNLLPISDFLDEGSKNPYKYKMCNRCRECDANYRANNAEKIRERNAKYYVDNAEKIKEYNAKYRADNAEKIKERRAKYRANNAEKIKESNAKYYADNLEKIKEQQAKYRADNAEKIKESRANYYANNAEKIKERNAKYRADNAEKIKERDAKYRADNAENEEHYRVQRKKARSSLIHQARNGRLVDTAIKFLLLDEKPEVDEEGYLTVLCKLCKARFRPTYGAVQNRLTALKGQTPEGSVAENNLYCSQECKDSCVLYGSRGADPAVKHKRLLDDARSEEWAEEVKRRAGYMCQECGSTERLEAHHIVPLAYEPSVISADYDNGICLCHACHMKAHSSDGCRLGELAHIRKCA